MCLPLIAQVLSVDERGAEIRLLEGQVTTVNAILEPDVKRGEYVLVDRGMIIEIVAAEQVQEMLDFYTELTNMYAAEDTANA
jgi:hydrogenase maturation factor